MSHTHAEMEVNLAMAILELVRIRRRLEDARTIESADRVKMAERIDKAFETANRFRVLENQKRTERLYFMVRQITQSNEFSSLKRNYPLLPFDDLDKVTRELEGYFGPSE